MPVTRGSYRYRLNGEIAPVEESWTLTESTGCVQFVESRRTAGDVSLAVTAELASGRVQSCDVEWQSASVPCVHARFELTGPGVIWRRTVGNSAAEGLVSSESREEVLLYPLMRIFTGPVIRTLARTGGEGQVLVPDISIADQAELLLPDVSIRKAVCEGEDHLKEHPGISCQRWLFIGGQYGETARFWLDEQSRMLRYRWLQSESQLWEVDLAIG